MQLFVEKIFHLGPTWFVVGYETSTMEKIAVKGSEEEVAPILAEFKSNDVAILDLPDGPGSPFYKGA